MNKKLNKKITIFSALLIGLSLTAAGCGNQHHQSGSSGQGITKLHHKKNVSSKNQSSSNSQSSSDQSSQQNSSDSQSSDKQSAKLWNSQKDQQLEAFMNK